VECPLRLNRAGKQASRGGDREGEIKANWSFPPFNVSPDCYLGPNCRLAIQTIKHLPKRRECVCVCVCLCLCVCVCVCVRECLRLLSTTKHSPPHTAPRNHSFTNRRLLYQSRKEKKTVHKNAKVKSKTKSTDVKRRKTWFLFFLSFFLLKLWTTSSPMHGTTNTRVVYISSKSYLSSSSTPLGNPNNASHTVPHALQ